MPQLNIIIIVRCSGCMLSCVMSVIICQRIKACLSAGQARGDRGPLLTAPRTYIGGHLETSGRFWGWRKNSGVEIWDYGSDLKLQLMVSHLRPGKSTGVHWRLRSVHIDKSGRKCPSFCPELSKTVLSVLKRSVSASVGCGVDLSLELLDSPGHVWNIGDNKD